MCDLHKRFYVKYKNKLVLNFKCFLINYKFKSESESEKILISTEMGEIPLASGDANLVKNINGIKLLCQQFGIMEEDFYEAMMSFE